ncbi:MAG: serine/threonine-protein kinase, partial [Gemmataceae bacterium]
MNDTPDFGQDSSDDRFEQAVEAIDAALEVGLDPDLAGVADAGERAELEGIKSCLRLLKLAYASPGGTTAAPAVATTLMPQQLGGYDIETELGHGGMGVVYLARQRSLDRLVALKVIAGTRLSKEDRARFRTEAESAARLHHRSIIEVHDVGEVDGVPYFSMEYMSAGNLADHLHGQPVSADNAAALVECLAGAVQHAHEQGVLHRDLKPVNVLLRHRAGRDAEQRGVEVATRDLAGNAPALNVLEEFDVKISDFGLAKRLDDDQGKTRTGAIIGTPSYMAPEQAEGLTRATGPGVDIYALGAILYELLTGRPPFQAPTLLETLEQVRSREPLSPRSLQPGVPRDLETICLTCLEKSPARRYQSARAVAKELARFRAGQPIMARPIGLLERSMRWAHRHRLVAGLLAAIAATLLLGITASMILMFDARAEARRADQNALTANQQAIRADDLARKASDRAEAATKARRQAEQLLYVN